MKSEDSLLSFEQYRISCPRCKYTFQKANRKSVYVSKINETEMIGICDHCRKKLNERFCICEEVLKHLVPNYRAQKYEDNRLWGSETLDDKSKLKKRMYLGHGMPVKIHTDITTIVKEFDHRYYHSQLNLSIQKKAVGFDFNTSEGANFYRKRTNKDISSKSHPGFANIINSESLNNDFKIKRNAIKKPADINRLSTTLELKTPQPMRNNDSADSILTSFSQLGKGNLKDFTYFFPKEEDIDTLHKARKYLSSSELIRDTRDVLQTRSEENKRKYEGTVKHKNENRDERERKTRNTKPDNALLVDKEILNDKKERILQKEINTENEIASTGKADNLFMKQEENIIEDPGDGKKKDVKDDENKNAYDKVKNRKEPTEFLTKPKSKGDNILEKNNLKMSLKSTENAKTLTKSKSHAKIPNLKEYEKMPTNLKGNVEEPPDLTENKKLLTKTKNNAKTPTDLDGNLKTPTGLQSIHDTKKNIKSRSNAKISTKAKENAKNQEARRDSNIPSESKVDFEKEYRKMIMEQQREKEAMKKLKHEDPEKKTKEIADKRIKESAPKKSAIYTSIKTPKPEPKYNLDSTLAKKEDKPASIEIGMHQIKMKKPSTDDLILKLIKLGKSDKCPKGPLKVNKAETNAIIRLLDKHKQHKAYNELDCFLCTSSDLELDLESLERAQRYTAERIDDIIIGPKICKYKVLLPELRKNEPAIIVPYQQNDNDFDVSLTQIGESNITSSMQKKIPIQSNKSAKSADQEVPKGIIRYALSDRTFIDKGWTMLPTEKVVRKMNVYRMRPAHPEFDWFEHNKSKRHMEYDTGEKLAEFNENGRGRWFYKNGRLALDYYDSEETNAQQRFVVFSSGEPDERGRSRPITILATFDYLGNGIVFDHAGKIRLKYNQTEGVVLDRSIGPVSHWKWHSLNDPPVLQQVMIDTQMSHKDPDILKLGGPGDNKPRPDNEEMLAIEFDNFIKEKSKKLTQKFKPFQIKMKALKINEQFSLKVLDQATIYLIFRDGSANLKLNIGMILDHKEIVDTDTAEVGEVSNSLERLPARTESIADLQHSVALAQRVERMRVERQRRLKPPEPCASADHLTAAASRPLRVPFRTIPDSISTSTGECTCRCIRRCSNVYYDTRLI